MSIFSRIIYFDRTYRRGIDSFYTVSLHDLSSRFFYRYTHTHKDIEKLVLK